MKHLEEILNRPRPPSLPDIPPATKQLHINISPPTKTEIIKAIKSMKSGKAADRRKTGLNIFTNNLPDYGKDNNTGIQWTFTTQLEDFADDISLISHEQQHAQSKLSKLTEEAKKTGLTTERRKKQKEDRRSTSWKQIALCIWGASTTPGMLQ
ncbi:hypothetical protein C0Q70_18517 [Pomacea canaliculata]|uniref:Reverse transcriptase domain-containing protein n=1 Tax=Pomacea canaliculata TaxID=400727 RepID=A0A2T7NGQ6_POMCA|nr:hypothetical protein C0Q70_18517 [Pomacea canaliculata]